MAKILICCVTNVPPLGIVLTKVISSLSKNYKTEVYPLEPTPNSIIKTTVRYLKLLLGNLWGN